VFVCNNNQFAYSTPLGRQTRVPDIAVRAAGYGIPGVTVDGTDVVAVYEAVREAVERARSGEGPSLIECKTLRVRGHSEHDDASYVPKALLEEWRAKDPIGRYERRLRDWGTLDDEKDAEIGKRISVELEAAIAWAEASPFPDPAEVEDGVYTS
jgi:pyruvate dehydrogenase E1 component alpha subunit